MIRALGIIMTVFLLVGGLGVACACSETAPPVIELSNPKTGSTLEIGKSFDVIAEIKADPEVVLIAVELRCLEFDYWTESQWAGSRWAGSDPINFAGDMEVPVIAPPSDDYRLTITVVRANQTGEFRFIGGIRVK